MENCWAASRKLQVLPWWLLELRVCSTSSGRDGWSCGSERVSSSSYRCSARCAGVGSGSADLRSLESSFYSDCLTLRKQRGLWENQSWMTCESSVRCMLRSDLPCSAGSLVVWKHLYQRGSGRGRPGASWSFVRYRGLDCTLTICFPISHAVNLYFSLSI